RFASNARARLARRRHRSDGRACCVSITTGLWCLRRLRALPNSATALRTEPSFEVTSMLRSRRRTLSRLLPLLALLLRATPSRLPAGEARPAASLDLRRGDRISIIGNPLADRLQHDGWLETYFYSRFPNLDLVFRNLGFSADELTVRLRSAKFGSQDE